MGMHSCQNNTDSNLSHLEQMVNGFMPYSQEQLGFNQPVKIVFQSDPSNADVLLGKTAHYNPETFEVSLFTDKRHPKDIMRSLSHELVHHAQNCRGDFDNCGDTGTGYAQRNPHLRKMEREAYTKGNLIFRDFEDLIKTGKITIDINFKDSGEPQMSLKEWKNNEINTKLMKKWGLLKEGAASGDEESSGHPGKSCEEAHPDDPSPAGHQDFSVSGDSYVGRSPGSGLEEISYRHDEEPSLAKAGGVVTKNPDGTHHYEGPFVGAEDEGDDFDDRTHIFRKKKGGPGADGVGIELDPEDPDYKGIGSKESDNMRGSQYGMAKKMRENTSGKISVKEAKQITRRIIERIRKEGK